MLGCWGGVTRLLVVVWIFVLEEITIFDVCLFGTYSRYIYRGALKILSHVLLSAHSRDASARSNGSNSSGSVCAKVIEHGGLKVLFPALMGTVKMDVT